MMKAPHLVVVLSSLLGAALLLVPAANSQESLRVDPTNGEQLYRSTTFRFRIRFPPGWTVTDGDGQHVRKKAVRDGATVLVLVRDAVTPAAVAELRRATGSRSPDAELQTSLRSELDSRRLAADDYPPARDLLGSFSDVEVISSRIDRLDNRPAQFVHARLSYSAGGITVRMEMLLYQVFHEGVAYQVQASAPTATFPTLRGILERSVRTFVIEAW